MNRTIHHLDSFSHEGCHSFSVCFVLHAQSSLLNSLRGLEQDGLRCTYEEASPPRARTCNDCHQPAPAAALSTATLICSEKFILESNANRKIRAKIIPMLPRRSRFSSDSPVSNRTERGLSYHLLISASFSPAYGTKCSSVSSISGAIVVDGCEP